MGGDGGVQHDGALPLPPLRVGQDAAAQVHRRLSGTGLCPAGSLRIYLLRSRLCDLYRVRLSVSHTVLLNVLLIIIWQGRLRGQVILINRCPEGRVFSRNRARRAALRS